jgi:hypothetical protein
LNESRSYSYTNRCWMPLAANYIPCLEIFLSHQALTHITYHRRSARDAHVSFHGVSTKAVIFAMKIERYLDEYLETLCQWAAQTATGQFDAILKAVEAAFEVASWKRPDWKEVHSILAQT